MKRFLNYYKDSITPPYNYKDVPVIALSAVLLFLAGLFIFMLSQKNSDSNTRSYAQSVENFYEAESGIATGAAATIDSTSASGNRYIKLGVEETGKCAALEAPPALDPNNTLIFENICPGDPGWPTNYQLAGKDVKITLPKDRVCTKRSIAIGGTESNPTRNIWMHGGKLDYTEGASGSAGLTFAWWSGTVFVEGIEIDINNSCNDGIRTYRAIGGKARVVIQNSYIRAPGYCPETGGTHGDMFHAQGANTNVNELVIQNTRGDLINQGIFVPWRTSGHGVNRMNLDRVELKLDARYKFPGNKISTMIYAWYSSANGDLPPPDGQSYKDVYLNWWDPWYPATIDRKNITLPSPESYDSNNCAVYSQSVKDEAKLTGTWCKGSPPNGTYVPQDLIGLNYTRENFCQ